MVRVTVYTVDVADAEDVEELVETLQLNDKSKIIARTINARFFNNRTPQQINRKWTTMKMLIKRANEQPEDDPLVKYNGHWMTQSRKNAIKHADEVAEERFRAAQRKVVEELNANGGVLPRKRPFLC